MVAVGRPQQYRRRAVRLDFYDRMALIFTGTILLLAAMAFAVILLCAWIQR